MKRSTAYPRWAHRLLQWYCSVDCLEEIEGDLFELFDRRSKQKRLWVAQVLFVWDVLRFMRWSNLKKPQIAHTLGQWILFRNYLKLGIRNLRKDTMINLIRIVGLALALGITITAYQMYDLQVNCDEFHSKADRIFQVTPTVLKTGDMKTLGYTPSALGPAFKKDFPQIEEIVRIERRGTFAHVGNRSFEENIAFVDPSFFQVFDFPMVYGERKVLQDRSAMVLSHEMALKLFPDQDPIGKEVRIQYGENSFHNFTVQAVLEKYSPYSSFQLDYMVAYENLGLLFNTVESWGFHSDATFVLAKAPNIERPSNKLDPYLALHNEAVEEYQVLQYRFFPLLDLPENYWSIERALAFSPPPYTRIACLVIAGLLLMMTIFNYINISLGAAGKRVKEVGIRKVFGSGKQQVAFQLIVENMVLCFLAFLLGVLFSAYFFTPGLNSLLPMDIPFSFSSYHSMIMFFLVMILLVGFISGAYPALYLSRFPAAHIMKVSGRQAGKGVLSRVLLTTQYILAFITLIGSIVFNQQTRQFAAKDWGYDHENVLMVRAVGLDKARLLKNELAQLVAADKVAISQGHIGMDNRQETVRWQESETEATVYRVEATYPEVLGLQLVAGQWWETELQRPARAALVNETLVKKMGWKDPLKETITTNGASLPIVGVVKDFYYRDFNTAIKPAVFTDLQATDYPLYYVSVKCLPGALDEVQQSAKKAMASISPDEPFVSKAQERAFDAFFEETNAGVKVFGVISMLTLVISALGIFGLLSFQLQQRLKEFSIRKVLGAGSGHLIRKIGFRYLSILLIGFLVGAPAGYFVISMLLHAMFSDPFAIGWTAYAITFAIILGSAVLAVAGKVGRVVHINPAHNLRNE